LIVDHDKVIGTYEPPTAEITRCSSDDKIEDDKKACSSNNNPSSYMTAAFRAQSNDDSALDNQCSSVSVDMRQGSTNEREPSHFKSV
jgi:hypothetical protein